MRGFIVLCLAACAVAAPQGYNYNPGPQVQQQHSSSGLSFGASQNFASTGLNTVSGSSGFVNTAPQQAFFGQQTQQVQQVAQQQQQIQQQQQAVISKRFFIHTAPEDVEEDYKERYITVGTPRKNYNVVFIKAPARSNKKTAIKIAPAVNEEKTVIYVLNKKTDVSDLQTEVVENAAPTSKPEVFFIKYKTNEEAQHAQREIQAQYDALGGSSQTSDEGVIPVTSVIGSLDNGAAVNQAAASTGSSTFVSGGQQQSGFQTGGLQSINLGTQQQSTATNNAYLPPNF